MRKPKKEIESEKEGKMILKYSIKEQIAKNAEDIEIIKNPFIKPSINKIEIQNLENNMTNPDNKFKLFSFGFKNKFDKKEYKEDLKDLSNVQKCMNNNEETNFLDNIYKINRQKRRKNNDQAFKSTAEDFKKKYKTELCKYYEINGFCKYGDNCAYAHGKENLRSKITNTTAYRTKNCNQFFQNGYCPYGNRCQFAHQVASNIINNPYDRKMTYKNIFEIISKKENIENIKAFVSKNRLTIFKEIVSSDNEIQSTLLNDIKNVYKKGIFERIDS